MSSTTNPLQLSNPVSSALDWSGPEDSIAFDEAGIKDILLDLDQTCFVVEKASSIGVTSEGSIVESGKGQAKLVTTLNPFTASALGENSFKEDHKCQFAFYAGSMAHGISSEEMVIALGKHGMLASFGAGGVVPTKLEAVIQSIQKELPEGPYAFNLIHNPFMEAMEKAAVDLFLKYGVRTVEASAYMDLTPYVVRYRVAGLTEDAEGKPVIGNKIIAKVSRREVAIKFMEPAPEKIVNQLVEQGLITLKQAELAKQVPMADDITVEADSGGHTDNRPLVVLLPSVIALRNEIQAKYNYSQQLRVGAAGGISNPESALAAFMMGAAYIVTGSVNQACVESGSSEHVKDLLAQAGMADVAMAPAFDMLEMGGKLQVLKRGTFFPMRAKKLGDFYTDLKSIEDIPPDERAKLEKQVFRKPLDDIWRETIEYFNERDPDQIAKAESNPKKKMALIFRWYLGQASHWANTGLEGREMDYQIWCGPAMGAFNDWVKGTYLEAPANRHIADVNFQILNGAAFQFRIQQIRAFVSSMPSGLSHYVPRRISH